MRFVECVSSNKKDAEKKILIYWTMYLKYIMTKEDFLNRCCCVVENNEVKITYIICHDKMHMA